MKPIIPALLALGLIAASPAIVAQSEPASPGAPSDRESIPLIQLIAAVSRKTGKRFVIDPRVRGDATIIGQSPTSLGYAELLTVLQVHGFVAAEDEGLVRIVPDAAARVLATATNKGTHPNAEMVNAVIPIKTMPAATLVPLLRPLLPQHAHLVALVCRNVLIMVDSYSNVKRIEALVKSIDEGTSYSPPEKCEPPAPTAPAAPAAPAPPGAMKEAPPRS